MTTLTTSNIKLGLEIQNIDNASWGVWIITGDRNGWNIKGRSGERMLNESDFKYFIILD